MISKRAWKELCWIGFLSRLVAKEHMVRWEKPPSCTEFFIPAFLEHRDEHYWVRPRMCLSLALPLKVAKT